MTPVILVADDCPEDRDEMVRAVRAAIPGARIIEASSGHDALKVLIAKRPVLSILDAVMMPGWGHEVAREARRLHLAAFVVSNLPPLTRGRRRTQRHKREVRALVAEWALEQSPTEQRVAALRLAFAAC